MRPSPYLSRADSKDVHASPDGSSGDGCALVEAPGLDGVSSLRSAPMSGMRCVSDSWFEIQERLSLGP